MGLLSTMDSAFEQISNRSAHKGPVSFSMLSTKNSGKNFNEMQDTAYRSANSVITGVTYAERPQIYDFLVNYGFVQSLVDLVKSTIQDVITKASFNITLEDGIPNLDENMSKKITEDTNEFISKLNLRDAIINDLGLYLYYGNYVYMVDFDKGLLKRVKKPHNVISVERYCRPDSFMIYNKNYKDAADLKEIKNDSCFVFQYNKIKINEASELDVHLQTLYATNGGKKLSEQDIKKARESYLKDHSLADETLMYVYYQGRGVFFANMQLLLLYYIKELLYDLLGMKDTIRPDIMIARIADDKTDESVIANAINDIEALVNDSAALDIGNNVSSIDSITQMLTGIQSYLTNGIKVVPGMNNFSNLDALKLPELTGKREALKNELDNLRSRILNNIGIPEELYNGQSNRWESISRSARYLTLIDQWVTEITLMCKTIAKSYIEKYYPNFGKSVKLDHIRLNLDTNNIIFNNYSNTRSRVISEKLDAIQRVSRSALDMIDNPLADKQAVLDYTRITMESIDPAAVKLLQDKLPAELFQQPQQPM